MAHFLGARIEDEQLERLDALAAALGLADNRSATIRAILDAPLAAVVLAVNVNQPTGVRKETAHLLQTGGAAKRAADNGACCLTSDTRGGNSHVIYDFTPTSE